MFCMNCGEKIPDGARFCPNCGSPTKFGPASEDKEIQRPSEINFIVDFKGAPIDVRTLHEKFGLFKKEYFKINAIKYVRTLSKSGLGEAKEFIDNLEKQEKFKIYFANKDMEDKVAFDKEAEALGKSVFCPKCHSQHIFVDKKGYSLTKGIVGTIILGPLGLVAGKHHSNRYRYKCLNCGYKWHD